MISRNSSHIKVPKYQWCVQEFVRGGGRKSERFVCFFFKGGPAQNTAEKIIFLTKKVANMCVGATKGTYRRDIKIIVNHDYIKQCIIFAKKFLADYTSKYCYFPIN